MKKNTNKFALALVLLCAGTASAESQFPIADMVAGNLVQHYQNSTCEQLWQEKAQKQDKPKSPREQEMIQILRSSPQMRNEFINKIAAPVVNKMFECGMIP